MMDRFGAGGCGGGSAGWVGKFGGGAGARVIFSVLVRWALTSAGPREWMHTHLYYICEDHH